jgi:hypothetical protein
MNSAAAAFMLLKKPSAQLSPSRRLWACEFLLQQSAQADCSPYSQSSSHSLSVSKGIFDNDYASAVQGFSRVTVSFARFRITFCDARPSAVSNTDIYFALSLARPLRSCKGREEA